MSDEHENLSLAQRFDNAQLDAEATLDEIEEYVLRLVGEVRDFRFDLIHLENLREMLAMSKD